ncbi:MAG TPA: segregation/condensation protein A, partial [Pontiella sp.]
MELSKNDYKVSLEVFEGPLDLLLYLIKKDEVDIYDIPIGRIADQYMEYLNLMKVLDLNIAGDFLVMSATLMLIKSRMLLPVEERTDESEEEEEDPRW